MDTNSILFITIVAVSLAATMYIFFFLYQQNYSIQKKNKQFTRHNLWNYSLGAIITSWVISSLLIIYYIGIQSITAIGLLIGSMGLFATVGYQVYNFIFPSPFWGRYELTKKKWNTTLDCRSAGEYEKGHYQDSIQWPIQTLNPTNIKERLPELKPPVLVYDNTGELSKQWIDMFYNLCHEMGLKRIEVVYTDAHWTQIPIKKA